MSVNSHRHGPPSFVASCDEAMNANGLTLDAQLSLELHRAALRYLGQNWPEQQRIMRANLAHCARRPRSALAEGWVRELAEAAEKALNG